MNDIKEVCVKAHDRVVGCWISEYLCISPRNGSIVSQLNKILISVKMQAGTTHFK